MIKAPQSTAVESALDSARALSFRAITLLNEKPFDSVKLLVFESLALSSVIHFFPPKVPASYSSRYFEYLVSIGLVFKAAYLINLISCQAEQLIGVT